MLEGSAHWGFRVRGSRVAGLKSKPFLFGVPSTLPLGPLADHRPTSLGRHIVKLFVGEVVDVSGL